MKKKDLIFIGVLCLVIVIGYCVMTLLQGEKSFVQVYHNKTLVQEISLDDNGIYEFKGDYGQFCLEIEDHEYRATQVQCPNHDCEKVGWVKQGSPKSIVCVPNNIYVIQSGVSEAV